MRVLSTAGIALLLLNLAAAQKSSAKLSLDELRFLIGEWEGVGEGGPGTGKGVFSFAFDLQNKLLMVEHCALRSASRPQAPTPIESDLVKALANM
jgi:hypothetical protein